MPSPTYSDIDFNLNLIRNGQGTPTDVSVKEDVYDIFQSIKNIILTSKYERPFSSVGVGLYEFKYEKINSSTMVILKQTILGSLGINEPRAIINSIDMVQPIPGKLEITVNFSPSYDPSIRLLKGIQV
jgi:phage baseplate assembly protein W